MVALYVSSKLEDENHITMNQMVADAGHHHFSVQEIVQAEQEVCLALNFRMYSDNVYEEMFKELKNVLESFKQDFLNKEEYENLETSLTFIAKVIVHDQFLAFLPLREQVQIGLIGGLDFHIKF